MGFSKNLHHGRTEFLFIRHAESTANAASHSAATHATDPALTARGQRQAKALCAQLNHCDIKALYCSDTARARATIQPLETFFEIERQEIPQIDEWNIGLGGHVDPQKMRIMLNEWCAGLWTKNLIGAPNSETLEDLVGRVASAFQTIFDRHKDDNGVVVIVAHGGSISWVLPTFASNLTLSYGIENYLGNACSVSVAAVDHAPFVVRWDGEFLFEDGSVSHQ